MENYTQQSKKKNKKDTWSALSLAWQLGYTIAIPLVILALTGRLLDKRFGTSPWLLLVGIFLSLIISTLAIYYKTIKILSEAENKINKIDKKEKPKNRTSKPETNSNYQSPLV